MFLDSYGSFIPSGSNPHTIFEVNVDLVPSSIVTIIDELERSTFLHGIDLYNSTEFVDLVFDYFDKSLSSTTLKFAEELRKSNVRYLCLNRTV